MFSSTKNRSYSERLDRAQNRVEQARRELHDAEWALEILRKEKSIERLMEQDDYGQQDIHGEGAI